MGNDLLMARVDLTPMLEGQACITPLLVVCYSHFSFGKSTHLINGTTPLLDLGPSISKLTSNLSVTNR
jgi:hypothetical protein